MEVGWSSQCGVVETSSSESLDVIVSPSSDIRQSCRMSDDGDTKPPPNLGAVQQSQHPSDIQEGSSDQIPVSDTSLFPCPPTSHCASSTRHERHKTSGKKESFGWRSLIVSEHPPSPSDTRPPCDPDSPSPGPSSSDAGDERVNVGDTAGDGHQDSGAAALVDGNLTPYSSSSNDLDIWHTQSRSSGRRVCRLAYLQVAAVISWCAMFVCVLAGEHIAGSVLFLLFVVIVGIGAFKKFVLPVLGSLCWRGPSAAAGGAREATVVQPPVRMADLVEMYP